MYYVDVQHRQYSENTAHVEVGSNTSTVALRIVGGEDKGTQCLGVWLGHPIPGRPGPPGWGSLESETVKWHESHKTWTWEWLCCWGSGAILKDRPSLSSERMLHKEYDRQQVFSWKKNCGCESKGLCRQDELIGGKLPVVKWLWLLTLRQYSAFVLEREGGGPLYCSGAYTERQIPPLVEE
jgi:hypothetical protein